MTTQKVRRSTGTRGAGERLHRAPTFEAATALDLACARFALRAVATLGPRFNLRRDINNVITLAGRYFVWPEPILLRVRDFLSRRCTDMPAWADCAKLAPDEFMQRHGAWNGLYDDSALYYYLDEYVKLHAKDLQAVFQVTLSALDQRLGKSRVRLVDNIAMLSAVLGLTDAEQSVLLHASLCKYQRDLRPVLVDCKASSAQEAYAMLAQVL
ncbi:MAG TPA: ATPase, partial [Quisquiliibacterium sp.]|nr:ATPase [Quisquiliibacterium sp.]